MLKNLLSLLTVTALLLLSAGNARSDYQFTFTDSTGAAANSFSVNAGATVDIRVYLTQTGSATGLSALGLNTGGVALTNYNTTIANVSNITGNSAFPSTNTVTSISGSTASITQDLGTPGGVVAPTTGADANRILLGTFTFTGVGAGSTNTLTASAAPGFNVNVLSDGTAIDNLIANSTATVTVTAVPEPGTLVLTGFLASGIAAGAWRRRRLSAKEE